MIEISPFLKKKLFQVADEFPVVVNCTDAPENTKEIATIGKRPVTKQQLDRKIAGSAEIQNKMKTLIYSTHKINCMQNWLDKYQNVLS